MRGRLPWLIPLALASALVLAACGGGGEERPPATAASPGATPLPATKAPSFGVHEVVSYQDEDGVKLVAEFLTPGDVARPPVAVLLHQFGGDRGQWADLVPVLISNGYAVFAPDLRSFGESTTIVRAGREERYQLTDLNDLAKDVAAALQWLKGRSDIDLGRIVVVGASVGANLAYVASGTFPEVKTAIALSPNVSPRGGVLLGRNVPNFRPHSILFMSDQRESGDARALARTVTEGAEVKVYSGPPAHGVGLLENPQAVQDILRWLSRTL